MKYYPILTMFAQPLGPTWDRSHEIYNLCSLETNDATYLIWKKKQLNFLKEVKHVQLLTPDADNERKAIEIIGGIDWFERSNSFDIPNFT